MKKIYLLGALALAGVALTSCDDFLNDNRYPLSKQIVNAEFWSNPVNVENQLNYLQENWLGYGNLTGSGNFYWSTLTDDQAGVVGGTFRDWKFTTVPTSSSSWSTPYTEIRRCNLIIAGVTAGTITGAQEADYIAQARMYRALQYYWLVRAYGDVPMIDDVLDTNSPELYGKRDNRNDVIDFAVKDLDFAIANMTTQSSKNTNSVDLARAIKTEVCLFEASYQRYTAKNEARAKEYYNYVVNASAPLVDKYELCANYSDLYQSLNNEILSNPEIILAKAYSQGVFMHSLVDYSSGSTPISGITKDAFDDYLFLDGKPKCLTSMNTNDAAVRTTIKNTIEGKGESEIDVLSIEDQLAVRDQRLAQTIYPVVAYTGFSFQTHNTAPMTSTTGYLVRKYNNFAIPYADACTANKNYTSAPIYWGAEMYLAYAEAKAELGDFTDADLNKTLNKLYKRAGLPAQTVASLSGMTDTANDMNVSNLIWEIRRCRRCELIMDNDIRYWDLVRWHQLEKLAYANNPAIIQGANVKNAWVKPSESFKVTGDYLNCALDNNRTWNDRNYLYPVPSQQRMLNQELTQNPGW